MLLSVWINELNIVIDGKTYTLHLSKIVIILGVWFRRPAKRGMIQSPTLDSIMGDLDKTELFLVYNDFVSIIATNSKESHKWSSHPIQHN